MSAPNTDFQRVQSQTGLLEKVMLFIPGFRGYKEKEMRRESDRMLRDRLFRSLTQAENAFKDVYRELVEANVSEAIGDADHLVAKLDRISEQINHAEAGYSGFYDAVKVREEDLDRMTAFDASMVDSIQSISQAVNNLGSEVSASKYDQARQHIMEITGMVNDLENNFSQRKNVIVGVTG